MQINNPEVKLFLYWPKMHSAKVPYSDEYWYHLLLTKDPVSRALTSIQKSIIIKECMNEARLQKTCIEANFGKQTAAEHLKRLGFDLIEEDGALMPSFLYLGLMEPDDKKISLNGRALTLVEKYILTYFPTEKEKLKKLREIVCFHELYHAIEECSDGIYTRNVRIRKKFLRLIPYNRTIEAASEIGAIHFSKLMSNVKFSPYLYTQYIHAAVNIELEVTDEH